MKEEEVIKRKGTNEDKLSKLRKDDKYYSRRGK
jgi:hypothetical protein